MTHPFETDRTWHIHLGAHKTATTHIQTELASRRKELAAKGSFYLPLQDTRALLRFPNVHRPLWWRLSNMRPGGMPKEYLFGVERFVQTSANQLHSHINDLAGNAERIVLSEENLLGTTDQVFMGNYFAGNARLNLIRALATKTRIRLFLSVRSLDGFLVSAYAQALRTTRAEKLGFAKGIENIANKPPFWSDLVTHICTCIPNAEITVWDYSEYGPNTVEILEIIAGCKLESRATSDRPKRTLSPSADAIRLAEKIRERSIGERLKIVEDIYANNPASIDTPSFSPLSDDTCKLLQEAFAEDLALISKLPNINLKYFSKT